MPGRGYVCVTTSDSLSLDATSEPVSSRRPATRPMLPPSWLRRLLRIVLAWSAAWWLAFGALMAPVLPGHWATVLVAADALGARAR